MRTDFFGQRSYSSIDMIEVHSSDVDYILTAWLSG